MNLHEYQAKSIFKNFGLNIPNGFVVFTAQEAYQVVKKLNSNIWVIKAQIHAGGRGLGGGVKIAKNLEEVKKYANAMLGMTLVTHQTGPKGKIVEKLYIEEGINIKKEFYLSIVFDRTKEQSVIIASTKGGVDIELVAKENPQNIVKIPIDPCVGLRKYHISILVSELKLDKKESNEFGKFIENLYKLYMEKDAQLVEINPLVKTKEGGFIALDAKITIDDSALFRQSDIARMRDIKEEDPVEYEASKYKLSYVKLDGNVGCMVNGAGLAMGVMDSIVNAGGKPANFLDVGGGADPHTIAKGFEIILKDKNVKSILVNIFGGIVRCDRVANGILQAIKMVDIKIPIIVRLDGTNAKEAMQILKNANIKNIISVLDIAEGSKKSVQLARKSL